MIRRNCCSTTSMLAAVQRFRMSPLRRDFTLRCVYQLVVNGERALLDRRRHIALAAALAQCAGAVDCGDRPVLRELRSGRHALRPAPDAHANGSEHILIRYTNPRDVTIRGPKSTVNPP